MALDPRIALAVQPTNISGAIQQGLEDRQAREMMPLELAAKQQQIDYMKSQQANAQAEADKTELLRQATGAKFTLSALEQLKSLPPEQRMPVWQMHAAKLKAMNFNPDNIAPEDVTTDEGLTRSISAVSPFVSAAEKKLGIRPVGTPIYTKENGKTFSNLNIFDEDTGQQSISRSQVAGEMLQQGQTPEEKMRMELLTAQGTSNINTNAALVQALNAIAPAGQKSAAETQGALQEKEVYSVLDNGRASMKARGNIARALELMKEVKTGGLNSIKNQVAQFLNMKNTANEGEIAAQFQNFVLDNMQMVPGNPTNTEGKRIEMAGPNFGFGNEANIVLLEKTLKAADKNIDVAGKVYKKAKQNNPEGYISFSPWFEKDEDTPPAGDKTPPAGEEQPKQNVRDILKGR